MFAGILILIWTGRSRRPNQPSKLRTSLPIPQAANSPRVGAAIAIIPPNRIRAKTPKATATTTKRVVTATAVALEGSRTPTGVHLPSLPEAAMGSPRSLPLSPLTVHQSLASFNIKRPLPRIKVGRRLLRPMVSSNQRSIHPKYYKTRNNSLSTTCQVYPANRYSRADQAEIWPNCPQISMKSKGAIKKITDKSPGFYSHLFLVPKKTGDLRPIINLKLLNNHITKEKFKMEMQCAIRIVLTKGTGSPQ